MNLNIQQYSQYQPFGLNSFFSIPSFGGGSSQPAGYAVTTGPTVQAANAAAQAQISAAQLASQTATADTQSAIQALMGEYSTALQYAGPEINTGNQAEAQMNYMLGLPAVNPGAAPVAPTAANIDTWNSATGGINSNSPDASQYNSLLGQATSILQNAGHGWAPDASNNAQTITMAAQLAGEQPSNLTDAGFLNQYEQAGGSIGETGTAFNQGFDATQNQNAQNTYNNAETIYNQQLNAYNQQEATYNQYSAMGQATPADISNIITNMPGYQFNLNQGISSIQNAASASGMLNSGALLEQLNQFGQGQASTYYNNYMNQLGGLAGLGTQATNTAATGATNVGNTTAGLLNSLGNTQANAYLAAGNAEASSYLNPAANQQVVATGYGSQGNTSGAAGIGSVLGGLGSLFGAL